MGISHWLNSKWLGAHECLRSELSRQEGQGMVEYSLILVLIAVVVIVILTSIGKKVNNVFSNISNGLAQ